MKRTKALENIIVLQSILTSVLLGLKLFFAPLSYKREIRARRKDSKILCKNYVLGAESILKIKNFTANFLRTSLCNVSHIFFNINTINPFCLLLFLVYVLYEL